MPFSLAMLFALMAAGGDPKNATGYCERDGNSVSFVDAIAFADARDEAGAVTNTLYLVSVPLDREALARCHHCGRPLPEKPGRSARREAIETQVKAANGGWLQARQLGGADATVVVVDIVQGGPGGSTSSIMLGNERVDARERDEDGHIAGKLASGAGFGNTCDAVFDLKVGWPKLEPQRD